MKKNLPTLISILILLLLTLLFFWKILLTNLILVGIDAFLYFAPYKAAAAGALRDGRLPLWNPYLFMGAPLLANSQVGIFYPLNWLFIWLDAPKQIAWSIGLHIALAGLLMLAYARRSLHLRWPAALSAAILFAFGGYLGAQVEHINQLNAAAWLPLLFLLYDIGIETPSRRWFWFLLLAIVVALTLLAGHAQTVYISLLGLGLYAVWRGASETNQHRARSASIIHFPGMLKSISSFLIHLFARYLWPLLAVSILAAGLAALQLIPTAELSSLSIRSGGLSFQEVISFSLSPARLHYALLPPLGTLDLSQVWDEAFSERVAYLGLSGLLLALVGGLAALRQRQNRRFVFLAAAGLVLSLGVYNGIYILLYYVMPGFNLFRVPPRWLLLFGFSAPILAGYGLEALLQPAPLRAHLVAAWAWLRLRWWRFLIFIGLPALFALGLIAWKTPPRSTLLLWMLFAVITLGLMVGILRFTDRAARLTILFIPLLIIELFWASQHLNYNHPTAPQAYHSLRNSIAFLRSQAANAAPPDRFLSLSGIVYDPGDLGELQQIFGASLSPRGLDKLITATKQKEVLFFNLPMLYGLHSVDGYDGGILPLRQFITLQKLFLPANRLSIDGRLRENLRFVPPARLLSLLNTRWIITDKMFDAWIDSIFYDLQFPAYLKTNQSIATTHLPDFPATAIGIVSHLTGAATLPQAAPVAVLTVTFADNATQTFTLKAGVDTAEGHYPATAAHPQANIGVPWPYNAQGVDYITILTLNNHQPITRLAVTGTLPQGEFVLKGLSLINQPTATSRSVILSTEGNYRQAHSGDVKIYENLDVLPRAFIVHQAAEVKNDDQAIAHMRDPAFDPHQTLVRVIPGTESKTMIVLGQASPNDTAGIVSYQPERVEITATLESPGWLVLTDTHYPGWLARVNGQPADILPANLMFRAVELPAGQHRIIFEFNPQSLSIGLWFSGLSLLFVTGGLIITAKMQQER